MELTPKLLETQHFPERFRGYDPEAVDDFLERVAAGIAEMQVRLDEVADRLIQAEREVSHSGSEEGHQVHDGRSEAVESIREALSTAPRVEVEPIVDVDLAEAIPVESTVNEASIAIGSKTVQAERLAQIVALAHETADDVVADAVSAAREQIGDLLADVLVASSSEVAASEALLRKAELEEELLELDARIAARRSDADQLAELIETRRRALGEIARDLSGRPDGPPVTHPAEEASSDVAAIDEVTNTSIPASAPERPTREAISGEEIDDPFFSALQRKEPLKGE